MIWIRAVRAFAFAAHPLREHSPFGVIARLPATWPVVCVGPPAVGMQRLQQKPALLGIPCNDYPRQHLKRPLRFLVRPGAVRLFNGSEADHAARVTVAAADVALAWRGKDGLHASPSRQTWRTHANPSSLASESGTRSGDRRNSGGVASYRLFTRTSRTCPILVWNDGLPRLIPTAPAS